jgi:hypothetical protein
MSVANKLTVLVNRMLRRIFGPKREEVTGEWRKLRNEEFRNLYSSLIINRTIKSSRMRWSRHVSSTGEMRNEYKILVGNHEGKRQFVRSGNRWEHHTKVDLKQKGCEDMEQIHLASEKPVMILHIP